MPKAKTTSETFTVKGQDVVSRIKKLIHEGNIRRITVKNKDGAVIMQLPLSFGVVGAVIAPALAVLGGLAALLTECTITIERK